MKNVVLFISMLALALPLNSCSDDADDNQPAHAGSTVSMTVDGAQKTFNNVVVTQSLYTFEELSVPAYSVLATNDENEDYLAFQIRQDYTGAEGLYEFIYSDADGNHTVQDPVNFTFNISGSSDTQVTGTFSGPLLQEEVEPTRVITNGSFTLNINF